MNTSPSPATPTPAAPDPEHQATRSRQAAFGCVAALLVCLLLGGVAAVGFGAGVWWFWDDLTAWWSPGQEAGPVEDFRWSSLAHGIEVREGPIPGQLDFVFDDTLAALWNPSENPWTVPAEDIPLSPDLAALASERLARAIRDRDDASAVYQIVVLAASPPSLRASSVFHVRDAIGQGRTELVLGMIHAGLPYDAVDANGNGPLHTAAMHNRLDTLRALIDTGRFDTEQRNLLGQTLLDVAVDAGADRVAAWLREPRLSSDPQ